MKRKPQYKYTEKAWFKKKKNTEKPSENKKICSITFYLSAEMQVRPKSKSEVLSSERYFKAVMHQKSLWK